MNEIEDHHIEKINEFFNKNLTLKNHDLINFLAKTELLSLFDSKEHQDYFWNILKRFTEGKEEIDKESCQNALRYVFKVNSNFDKSDLNSIKDSELFDLNLSNSKMFEENYFERKPTLEFVTENGKIKFNVGNYRFSNTIPLNEKKKRLLSILSDMTMSQYEEYRKVLSLIEIKNKFSISILEIQELIQNNSINSLSQNEIINLLLYISEENYDYNQENNFIIINRRLLEENIKKLDNFLNTFYINTNPKTTYYLGNTTPLEGMEDMIKICNNSHGYLLLLKDYCSQILSLFRNEIVPTLEDNFVGKTENARNLLDSEIESLLIKIKSIDFFANHWKKFFNELSFKSNFVKESIIKYEGKIHNLEVLNDHFHEISRELPNNNTCKMDFNKLIVEINEENNILTQKNDQNLQQINSLSLTLMEKDKIIFYLNEREEELREKNADLIKQYDENMRKLEESKAQYNILINETLKIQEIDENQKSDETLETNYEMNSYESIKKVSGTTLKKIKSSIHLNDNVKTLLDFKHEELIMYTVNVQKDINELKNSLCKKEEIITKTNIVNMTLNRKIEKLKERNYKLREENFRLQSNYYLINKVNQNSNLNKPSQILNNIFNVSYSNLQNINFEGYNNLDKTIISDVQYYNNKKRDTSVISFDKRNKNYDRKYIENQMSNRRRLSDLQNSFGEVGGKMEKLQKNFDITQNNIVLISEENIIDLNHKEVSFCKNSDKDDKVSYLSNDEISILDSKKQKSYKITNEFFFIDGKNKFKNTIEINEISGQFNNKYDLQLRGSDNASKNNSNTFSFKSKNLSLELKIQEDSNQKSPLKLKEEIPISIKNTDSQTPKLNNDQSPQIQNKNINKQFCSNQKLDENDDNSNKSFEDITLIMTNDSYINNYDFISLKKNNNNQEICKQLKGENLTEIFSFNINYLENINKKLKRVILITCKYILKLAKTIYILKLESLEIKDKFSLKKLVKLTISKTNPNLLAFHFKRHDDILVEIVKRSELLIFLRDMYIIKKRTLRVRFSDNFEIKKNNEKIHILINEYNKMFIAPNFENAQKLGYIDKYNKGFFTSRFKEKFVVLTDIGLLYFDDPNDKKPEMLIPIFGSKFYKVEDSKYKEKNCFEILTINQDIFAFRGKTEEETKSWLKEFTNFKNRFENKLISAGLSSKKKKLN